MKVQLAQQFNYTNHYMKVQLAQQFNYTMATMEGKNNDAMAETSPFETSKKIFFFPLQKMNLLNELPNSMNLQAYMDGQGIFFPEEKCFHSFG